MTHSNQHTSKRTIEQVIADEIANEAANTPITKSPEQLHSEFQQRKQARYNAKPTTNADNDLSLLLPENTLKHDAETTRKAKTNFACSLVRSALQRHMQTPSQLSLALLNHPCFCLLFRGEQRLQLLANQVPLNLETFESHDQLLQLSLQLKIALPDLAVGFENAPGLAKVWQQAVLVLLCSPLPLALYENLASTDFAAQVSASYQKQPAKQVGRLQAIGKTLFSPCRWPAGIYSWFVLRRLSKKLKQA